MKSIRLFSAVAFITLLASCSQLQQATNTTTTGAVFSLTGKWQLISNAPENTLLNTVVTVTPIISQGTITSLQNNTQCYRENDVKWKSIKADKAGGSYTIENLLSNCSSGGLNYQPATITVINNTTIKLTGQNAAGQANEQTWTRVQ